MVLNGISPNIWSLGLERVRIALERLGHPEKSYPHVLVAGTNGKGSTCIYLERILSVMGLRVGTTISPHVTDFTERFRIDGHNAAEEELAGIRSEIEPLLEDIGLTYFEWCVILAAMIFARHRVEYGIFEIGLGGRFDAANALDPRLCLITEISLDHMQYLGSTVEKIAQEKAAIARRGRPLITMATGQALEVIRSCAAEAGAMFKEVNAPSPHRTSLRGSSQAMNAALATEAAYALGFKPSESQLSHALSTAFLPGRIEDVGGRIILDVAHNPSSLKELIKYLDQSGFNGVGVFGVLSDKDYPSMIKMLKDACSRLYIAPVQSERSWRLADMEPFLQEGKVMGFGSIREAFQAALSEGEKVVVAGSFYTVGEVRESIVCTGF